MSVLDEHIKAHKGEFPYRGGRRPSTNDEDAPLNDKQLLFVAEYLVDLNGAQAAIRAGYKPDNAAVTASEILRRPNVRAEVRRQYGIIYSSLGTKAQRVLAELCRIGFSDVRELFDDNGNLLDVKDLPDSIASTVSSVEITRKPGRDGDTDEYVSKIRLWDKTKALSMLGKHFGILRDVIEHTGPGGGPIQVESNSLQVESLPLFVKQLLVVVGSGKSISPELERALMDELGPKYLEVEYEILGRESRGEKGDNGGVSSEPKQLEQRVTSSTPHYSFTKGSAHEFKPIGRPKGSVNGRRAESEAELKELEYLDDL